MHAKKESQQFMSTFLKNFYLYLKTYNAPLIFIIEASF